jgi:hypothetical protein
MEISIGPQLFELMIDTELNKGQYASMNAENHINVFARTDIFYFKAYPGDVI